MEKVCPICNGLETVQMHCPACGAMLIDVGTVESFVGPYAPYEEAAQFDDEQGAYCEHLLACPYCFFDIRKMWELVII